MGTAAAGGRRPIPDFVIAGFSKCGTTTLFEWLASLPEVSRGGAKEPGFFAYDDAWRKGWDWYASVVGDPAAGLVGDGSPAYLDPAWSVDAASRLAEHRPDVRILILYRDPVERAISHFRHEVRRGREKTALADVAKALTLDSPYVRASRFASGLAPFVERFPPEQMLVIPLDRLGDTGWVAALDHLGLPVRLPPQQVHNDSSSKRSYTPAMRLLYDRGIIQKLERRVPAALRRTGGRLLLRRPVGAAAPTGDVRQALPPEVGALLRDEWERFHEMIVPLRSVPEAG